MGRKLQTTLFEGGLQYKGPDKVPISVFVGTYFYGNDRKITPDLTDSTKTTIKQNYSTYIELGYTVKYRKKLLIYLWD